MSGTEIVYGAGGLGMREQSLRAGLSAYELATRFPVLTYGVCSSRLSKLATRSLVLAMRSLVLTLLPSTTMRRPLL
eukprot:3941481-Rhodomonas_salina.1